MDVVKEDMKLVGDRRGWGEMKADDWMIGQWPPAKEIKNISLFMSILNLQTEKNSQNALCLGLWVKCENNNKWTVSLRIKESKQHYYFTIYCIRQVAYRWLKRAENNYI